MVASNKVLVLGVDGMFTSIGKKYMKTGVITNFKNLTGLGSNSRDMKMLGGRPTIPPPMWTSVFTGATSPTHCINWFRESSKN